MSESWSLLEQQATVVAYLNMLKKEKRGEAYNKAAVNQRLRQRPLTKRTKSSVEYRMQNISAVLQEAGEVYSLGYKPARNVGQKVKEDIKGILAELITSPAQTDPADFETRVWTICKLRPSSQPTGQDKPVKKTGEVTAFVRDPLVKAWVLNQANGICEGCGSPAPFINRFGEPYLEVHHMIPLAQQRPDTPENAVALCANCHRRCHYSQDRKEFME